MAHVVCRVWGECGRALACHGSLWARICQLAVTLLTLDPQQPCMVDRPGSFTSTERESVERGSSPGWTRWRSRTPPAPPVPAPPVPAPAAAPPLQPLYRCLNCHYEFRHQEPVHTIERHTTIPTRWYSRLQTHDAIVPRRILLCDLCRLALGILDGLYQNPLVGVGSRVQAQLQQALNIIQDTPLQEEPAEVCSSDSELARQISGLPPDGAAG